jgi:hypothetical protein
MHHTLQQTHVATPLHRRAVQSRANTKGHFELFEVEEFLADAYLYLCLDFEDQRW